MPRTATVTGSTDCSYCVILSIEKRSFNKFIDAVELDFVEIMKERICEQFRSTDCAFFQNFPESRMPALAKECELTKVTENEWIFKEGDEGDQFYIIVGGKVTVSREGREIATLSRNQYFGEIALISDSPRTASVQSKSTCLLLSMTKHSFRTMFYDCPESLAEVELKILGKKTSLRSVIYHPEGYKIFEAYLVERYAAESLRFWKAARTYRHSMDYVYERLCW